MTDEQKSNKEQFQNCCEGIYSSGIMEAMMSQKEELCGCRCPLARPSSRSPDDNS